VLNKCTEAQKQGLTFGVIFSLLAVLECMNMNELIILLAVVFTAYIFMPAGLRAKIFPSKPAENALTPTVAVAHKLIIPEDSMLKRHFLTHLRAEVENELLPQSSDSTLRHYYEASVAAEIQKRLQVAG
jgi:hypothetical protein